MISPRGACDQRRGSTFHRRIFRDYANGLSPVKIAAALNAECPVSPCPNGIGPLEAKHDQRQSRTRNPGFWTTSSMPVSGSGTGCNIARIRRPRSRCRACGPFGIATQDAQELRIVDQSLWDTVKDRQGRQINAIRKRRPVRSPRPRRPRRCATPQAPALGPAGLRQMRRQPGGRGER